MSLQQLFTSRKSYDAATYVARAGKMFYDEATGNIRLGDGITAGGLPIPITLATSNTAGAVKPAPGFTVSSSGTLTLNAGPMFELTVNDEFILKAATDVQIGGVKLGPGVTTNGDGQIIIDPEGLSFSFGDFTSTVGT